MVRAFIVAGAVLASAAPAVAADVDYSVVIDGEASYNRADVYADGTAGQHDHGFVFRTTIPTVRFHGDGSTTVMPLADGSAAVTRSHFGLTGPEGEYFECSGGTTEDVRPGGLTASGRAFAVRPLGAVSIRPATCDEVFADGSLSLLGAGPMDGRFTVSPAEIGEPLIVRTLSGDTRDARCPLQNPNTELCSLSWTATVTFKRDDDPLVVPLVPEPDPLEELFVPLVAKARVTPSRAVLPLRCAAACAGSAVARARGAVLGRSRFRSSEGGVVRVAVPLRRQAAQVRLTVSAGGERRSVTVRRAAR